MTPRSCSDLPPRMVCVLPVPVTPYAKMVTSNPLKRCLTLGETMRGISKEARRAATHSTAHTLIVKDLGLCCVLWVDAVELEGEALALVLRVGDLDDGLCVGRLCACGVCGVYNYILLDLGVEERANASDYANAHDCGLVAVSLAVSFPLA
jgi:hypothetical protein